MAAERVARVIIDLDVPHLDRPFDYRIPGSMADRVAIGSMVRIWWGSQRHNGWVVEVSEGSDHSGPLSPLLRVVSAKPLFTPKMLDTYRYLATRFASTLSQVLSLAIPARRAKVEKSLPPLEVREVNSPQTAEDTLTQFYPGLGSFPGPDELPRIVVQAVPGKEIDHLRAVLMRLHARKVPAIVVVPTLAQAKSVFREMKREEAWQVGLVDSELPAPVRYEVHLRARQGDLTAVIGTRTAVWTPFQTPGVVVVWDDASDHQRERRNPQVDALDVAVARCRWEGFGLVVASYGRSVKAQALVESGWATSLEPDSARLRRQIPRIRLAPEDSFEREGLTAGTALPNEAYDLMRRGLLSGPILVQVPGIGRQITTEHGETIEVGADRMGRELGRAFPGVSVVVSASSAQIHRHVSDRPQIVIATPGAEPKSPNGYAAVIATEAHVSAYANRLAAPEEALSRFLSAFALSVPGSVGMVTGQVPEELGQALVLWRPALFAHHLLEERGEVGFFPARWVVGIEGSAGAVGQFTEELEGASIESLQVLGSVEARRPEPDEELDEALFTLAQPVTIRTLLSCDPPQAMPLMESLRAVIHARSLQREEPVRILVNPPDLFDG